MAYKAWINVVKNGVRHVGPIRLTVDEKKLRIRGVPIGKIEIPVNDISRCETGADSGWLMRDAVCVWHNLDCYPNPIFIKTFYPVKLLNFLKTLGVPTQDGSNAEIRGVLPVQIVWSIMLCYVFVFLLLFCGLGFYLCFAILRVLLT